MSETLEETRSRIRALVSGPGKTSRWILKHLDYADEDWCLIYPFAWETWPRLKWRQEVGQYRNTRGGWCHGQATHFQPLPAPPLTLPDRGSHD